MTSVSDVKFGTLVLRAGDAGWLRFILWLKRVSPKTQLYSFSGTNMTNMVYFVVFYHSR